MKNAGLHSHGHSNGRNKNVLCIGCLLVVAMRWSWGGVRWDWFEDDSFDSSENTKTRVKASNPLEFVKL